MRVAFFMLALIAVALSGSAPAVEADAPSTSGEALVRVATSGGQSPEWTERRYNREDLWAFAPLGVPKPPGMAHPIDAFIDRQLWEAGLDAAPAATRRELVRRATFDLIGLPPTPAEVEAFVRDDSDDAFEKLIDRLMGRPAYGERMAQHWLDVTRYADSDGFSNDYDRPNSWRYRDYVIKAFNDDKPYNRFIVEQIAGDELDPGNPEYLIAAGYLRMGPWEHTGMSVAAETRQQYLDDVTHAVGETFLGVGLRCAKCHDHKFDPIPTRDYYRLQAVFAPVQFAHREVPYQEWENTSSFDTGRAMNDRRLKAAKSELGRLFKKENDAIIAWLAERELDLSVKEARQLPEEQRPPRNLGLSNEDLGVQKVWSKTTQLLEYAALRYEPLAMSVYSGPPRTVQSGRRHDIPGAIKGEPEDIHILIGGSLASPGDEVEPGVLSAPCSVSESGEPEIPDDLTGRRLALANWIADARNPLTARVMVNRIWQWHFGRGLAANSNNFGRMGAKPSHPELLDYLARQFIDSGWSVKHIHRLIMTSQAYRRASSHPEMDRVRELDTGNALLSYYPTRRLTAEELRDAMLAASGELNPEVGGPPVHPEINPEVALQPRHIMGSTAPAYQPSPTPAERHRRSIYTVRIRTLRNPMFEVFDQPSPDVSCERRDASTIAPQAFSLFNGTNSYDRAIAMALRLEREAASPLERVARAFALSYGREPTDEEAFACLKHIDRMTTYHAQHEPSRVEPTTEVVREMVEEMTGLTFTFVDKLDVYDVFVPDMKPWDVPAETRALADLCLVLFNSNGFIYVD